MISFPFTVRLYMSQDDGQIMFEIYLYLIFFFLAMANHKHHLLAVANRKQHQLLAMATHKQHHLLAMANYK